MSRLGSRWMSEARCSNAYCHSQSTMLITCWSLASTCLLALPSSTSCSKLLRSASSLLLLLLAFLIDLARLKNCVVYWAMSSGLAITRRMARRDRRAISASHSVALGSEVATTSMSGVSSTGRMWKRAA